MKKILLFASLASLFLVSLAATARSNPDKFQTGSQYLAYPVKPGQAPALTPAPDGYEPFHMEHYGRHGSRWLISENAYSEPLRLLQLAHDHGKLTPRGECLLEEIRIIAKDSEGRLGELTPLGHRQHREIAERMAQNFPEIFNNDTYLDAKSTQVIRCILSMANEMAEFQKLFPGMKITMDASATTQDMLNPNNSDTAAYRIRKANEWRVDDYRKSLPKPEHFYNAIFSDRKFVTDSIGEDIILDLLFEVASNMQSHDDYPYIYDIFTDEELVNEWKIRNASWYVGSGNTSLSENRMPLMERPLLQNMIESPDSALFSPVISANLRFGHESMLLPLSALMMLDNAGYDTEDLSSLSDNWRNYEIFPMASNIQMVFYRPKKDLKELKEEDILVKVLLNEKETTLPLTPVSGPYYRWTDARQLFKSRISAPSGN